MKNSDKSKKIGKWTAIAALAFLPLAYWLAFVVIPSPPQLISPLTPAQVAEAEKTPVPEAKIAKRTRHVTLDPEVMRTLQQSEGSLSIELFPNETVTIDFERAEPDAKESISVTGTIRGQPSSQVVLVTHKGALGGSVSLADGRSFLINYTGKDRYAVVELDHSKMSESKEMQEHLAAGFPSPDKIPKNGVVSMPQLPWGQTIPVPGMPWFTTTLIGAQNPWPQMTNVYGPPVIGTMILYTPEARDQLAGLLGVETRIRLAVSQINECFRKSGTSARIRLMHSGVIEYGSTGNITTDLKWMTYAYGPQTPEIHVLREQHRADLVTLMVPDSGQNLLHGTSWLLTSDNPAPSYGFNVIEAPYVNTSVLVHEIGHNLGCNHAPNDIGAIYGGAFTNSFGYRFSTTNVNGTANLLRTIMAYGPGRRVGFFSSPTNSFYGVPMGNATHCNNVYTIERTAPMVGTYMSGGYGPPYYYNPATSGGTQLNSQTTAPGLPPPPYNRVQLRQPGRSFRVFLRN